MTKSNISIISIPQLKDNYTYIIKDKNTNNVIIIDPAESKNLLNYLKKNKLKLISILLTHHHHDHTAGVKNILNNTIVPVYSPSEKIYGTSNIVNNGDKIYLKFITINVITSPGHTLDHIVYHDVENKILFSGDVLFRLGCGRIFEGTYEIMYKSLKKIKKLDNDTTVYCGHEYTINNLNFLLSIFPDHSNLKKERKKIIKQLSLTNSSIPFNLGKEKVINPFLSSKSSYYEFFKKEKNFGDFEMFSHLRALKDNF